MFRGVRRTVEYAAATRNEANAADGRFSAACSSEWNGNMRLSRRKGALCTAVAGMELCCFYSALGTVTLMALRGFPPILWLLSFYPVAFVYNSALQASLRSRVYLYGLCWVGWLIWLAALFKIQFLDESSFFDAQWMISSLRSIFQVENALNAEQITLISSIVLWWCGRRLSLIQIEPSTVFSEFQFSMAIFLIILFIESHWDGQTLRLVPVILVFFLFSLFGMAAAHGQDARGWITSIYRNHWLGFLVFYVVLIMAAGLFLGAVIKPDLLKIMVSSLKTAWELVANIISRLIAFLMDLFPGSDHGALPPVVSKPIPDMEPSVFVKLFQIPESVRKVSGFIMACIWIGLILLALWRVSTQIFEWLRQRLANGEGAEVEPISGAFREDMIRLFKAVIKLLSKWMGLLGWPFGRAGRKRNMSPEAGTVREVYRQMLLWAASRGCPRDPSQTPHEYLNRLLEWLPEGKGELGFLTDHYVNARYGPSVPTRDGLERMIAGWKKLRRCRPTRKISSLRLATPSL
jgi:hypothetical protein